MRFFTTILVVVFLNVSGISQNNSVPFRVGNLFGISDSLGTIKILPKFDVVDVNSRHDLYFIGYNLHTNKSSLIYNNKEILPNTNYRNFYIENELVIAIKYVVLNTTNRYYERDFDEINHLYDKNGKPIIIEDCNFISTIENADDVKTSNEVLFYFQTKADKKYSLILYDKKKHKIVKTYIDKSNYLEINFNGNQDYRDKSHSFIYRDKNGLGKKITLLNEAKGITYFTEESYTIKTNADENSYDYYDVAAPYYESKPKTVINSNNDSVISVWRKLEIKRDFYYKPRQIEKISVLQKEISKDWAYIIKKDNKVGLRLLHNYKLEIPIRYDEILIAEFVGHSNCYILKKNNKYGASISGFGNDVFIEPIFKQLFLVENPHFFGKKSPLIKLFNDDGTFYAYAKADGTIFAK